MGLLVGGWVCFGGSVVMGGFGEAGRLEGPRRSLLTCGPSHIVYFLPAISTFIIYSEIL